MIKNWAFAFGVYELISSLTQKLWNIKNLFSYLGLYIIHTIALKCKEKSFVTTMIYAENQFCNKKD